MKLTLRELFLLVALVAVGCGWWVDHNQRLGVRRPGEVIQGDVPLTNDVVVHIGPGMQRAKLRMPENPHEPTKGTP